MKMSEIRARLEELAEEHNLPELIVLANETRRRFNGRAPIVSQPVTPAIERFVRAYADAYPDMALHEIARRFDINQGRVSEILNGERE